jgi:hypothetical protein
VEPRGEAHAPFLPTHVGWQPRTGVETSGQHFIVLEHTRSTNKVSLNDRSAALKAIAESETELKRVHECRKK